METETDLLFFSNVSAPWQIVADNKATGLNQSSCPLRDGKHPRGLSRARQLVVAAFFVLFLFFNKQAAKPILSYVALFLPAWSMVRDKQFIRCNKPRAKPLSQLGRKMLHWSLDTSAHK